MISIPGCMGVSLPSSNSVTPAGYLAIHLNSDTRPLVMV